MIIFVAGLSKSGKSTRSQYAAAQLAELEYVSVSKLLTLSGGILPVRTFADALFNQQLATELLLRRVATKRHQIIDGHALIETAEGPIPVPDSFFEWLRPSLMIYIYDQPDEIRMRRVKHGMSHSRRELIALMAMEQAACERVADRQGIPLDILLSPTLERFASAINRRLIVSQ
ncbi:AAA family ATPase [Methylobacterium gossipiicola]|uniref:AAA family ATPase n=1 Tax=Methylobacterium gossipiicola TaxID=582675 RepID=UPI0015A52010|nr:AAA family ATPase [Methylobacterium gossipiicola]